MPVTRAKKRTKVFVEPENNFLPTELKSDLLPDEIKNIIKPRRVTRSCAILEPSDITNILSLNSHKISDSPNIFQTQDSINTEIVLNNENSSFQKVEKENKRKKKRNNKKKNSQIGKSSPLTLSEEISLIKTETIPKNNKRKTKSGSLSVQTKNKIEDEELETIIINESICLDSKKCISPLKRNSIKMNQTFSNLSGIIEIEDFSSSPKTSLKRENTYTKSESTQILSNSPNLKIVHGEDALSCNKKHTFAAASPCKLFKNKTPSIVQNGLKTPTKTFCRSISVGSAGRTPMPPLNKSAIKEKATEKLNNTPINKARILNVTHSLEKPEIIQNNKEAQSIRKGVTFGFPIEHSKLAKDKSELKKSNLRYPARNMNTTQKGLRQTNKAKPIVKEKLRGINKQPKKTMTAISGAKSKQIANIIRSTFASTPSNQLIAKPIQPTSRSKMPNFASLHKKQFEQMESLIQNKARKEERAKKLLFGVNTPGSAKKGTGASVNNQQDASNAPGYTRFGFKLNSDNYKNLPNVNYKDSPKTRSTIMSKIKEQAKDVFMQEKVTTVIQKKKNENRDYIAGVRTNRRFELQMKARNVNT